MTQTYLIPEWAEQAAIVLAWPDKQTDWAPWLLQARRVYCELIQRLNDAGTGVLLLIRQDEKLNAQSMIEHLNIKQPKVLMIQADYNDTWTRDYTFLTRKTTTGNQAVDFVFNGWGKKFDATKDNLINKNVLSDLCQLPMVSYNTIVEGGALEIDNKGHLLSTGTCLYNPKRNGNLNHKEYQTLFESSLGTTAFTVLSHGKLEGDDTDGHIDTLVRFTPNQGLVIQSSFNRPQDSHYDDLEKLVEECRQTFPQHTIYELPLPAVFDDEGERLPASYANFLINNEQVLCPVYRQPEDDNALTTIQLAFPSHKIVAIDCLAIVQQFGSLHCITMQVPTDTLKPEVVEQMNQGISCLA